MPNYVGESVNPDQSTLNKDGFVGVDPIYQNHANDTDAPLVGEEPVEAAESDDEKKAETPATPEPPKAPKASK